LKGNLVKRTVGVAALAIAVLAIAAPAYAHVTVSAPGAVRGGSDQLITFRVPVEKTVATVKFTLALPTDTPIASVLVQPIAGWTHTQKSVKLKTPIETDDGDITEAVSQITWTAQTGHGLQPGEFGSFTIIAGTLPAANSVRFSAIQTYADGSSVKWNQVPAPGSSGEPENPAPVLALPAGTSTTRVVAAKPADTTGATVLSIVALVLAAAALGLAVVGRAKRGRVT